MTSKGQFENNPDLIGPRLKNRAFYSSRYYQERYLEKRGGPNKVSPEKQHEYNQRSYARRSKDPAYRERMRTYRKAYEKTRPPRVLTAEQLARHQAKIREWHYAHKDTADYKLKQRKGKLRRKYGITIEQQNAMLASQNNRCALCPFEFTATDRGSPRVDHCHAVGKVRQLLCDECNKGLGTFRDDSARLRRAADYIDRHNERFAKEGNDESNNLRTVSVS